MTRKEFVKKVFDAGDELTPKNQLYADFVSRYLFADGHDVTTKALIGTDQKMTARIVKKSPGISCGIEEILHFIPNARVSKDDNVVIELNGNARDILALERTCLNLLMRMSGIATFTRKMVDLAGPDVLLVPTRKTLWGLLDKRACHAGGGGTHRLDLHDAILIKDNHLSLLDYDIEKALKMAFKSCFGVRFVEIEVETRKDATTAHNVFKKLHFGVPAAIMFDNMAPSEIRAVLDEIGETDVLFEASGGITGRNLKEYAETGVDVISMGELTMNAPALDFSMEVSRSKDACGYGKSPALHASRR